MNKIYIEVQYDETRQDFAEYLVAALSQVEFASVTGDVQFTVVRGELQHPEPPRVTTFKRGGVW